MKKLIVLPPLALATSLVWPSVVAAGGVGTFSPGRWEGTMRVVRVTTLTRDRLPPQVANRMKAAMGGEHSFVSCLTPEEIKDPAQRFFGGDNDCRYDRFIMRSGKIDAETSCVTRGVKRTMTMTGTYSSERYQVTMVTAGTPSGTGSIGMTLKVAAKRTGECTGKEDG